MSSNSVTASLLINFPRGNAVSDILARLGDWSLEETHNEQEAPISKPVSISEPIQYETAVNDDNSSELAQLDRTINETIHQLERYLNFEKGWDGYNGSQFDFETIKRSKQILSVIQKYYASIGSLPDEICPGPASDGSVDIEISHENRHFIFTIYPDERQINYYYQYGDDKRDGEISFSKPDLANWISGIYRPDAS